MSLWAIQCARVLGIGRTKQEKATDGNHISTEHKQSAAVDPCVFACVVYVCMCVCVYPPAGSLDDVENRERSLGGGILGVSHVFCVRHQGVAVETRSHHTQRRSHHMVSGGCVDGVFIAWYRLASCSSLGIYNLCCFGFPRALTPCLIASSKVT